jgi:cell wall-associated NlpC family hydrolase
MRRMLTLFLAASAAVTGACASSGAVPRPFPTPGGTSSRTVPADPIAPADPATDGSPTPQTRPNTPAQTLLQTPAQATPSVDTYALTGTALALRGRPYRNGGADPTGFDCSGFTQYVFGHYGIPLPREVKEQFTAGRVVKVDEIAPGDLMFFTTVTPGASHVGISLGGDEFVHAPSSTGVVRVEHLSAPYWSQRFIGARRIT